MGETNVQDRGRCKTKKDEGKEAKGKEKRRPSVFVRFFFFCDFFLHVLVGWLIGWLGGRQEASNRPARLPCMVMEWFFIQSFYVVCFAVG